MTTKLEKIGFIALGVPDDVMDRTIRSFMLKVRRGTAYYHKELFYAWELDYARLGGVESRCVKVAASFVWRCTKLVYMTTFERRRELEDAIAVATRVGRPFEVYLFKDTDFKLSQLMQCIKKEKV